jgi:hypothetical protein
MNNALCGRVGCGEPAVAVLLMSPQDTQAWIVAPDHQHAPGGVPLCAVHADRISVPFGWSLTDDRPAPKRKRRRKNAAPAETEAVLEAEPSPEASVEPTAEVAQPPASAQGPDPEPDPDPAAEASAEPLGETEPRSVELPEPAPAAAGATGTLETDYVAPEDQYREDDGVAMSLDAPTVQVLVVGTEPPTSPSEVPLDAEHVAASVDDTPRLSVVPGDDDPTKTYDFSDEGQGAFWHEPEVAEAEPDESTPLLQRAFRVVRDD